MHNDPGKFARDLEARIKAGIYRGTSNRRHYQGLIPGAVLVAIGFIFLLDHYGIVQAWQFFRFWPLILIFAGLINLADPCRRFWGVGLCVFGCLLQLSYLGVARFSWEELWPLALIAAGSMAMWKAVEARKMVQGAQADSSDPRSTLNESAVFGGIQKRVNARDFRGGQLHSMFGGIEIDLRDADIDGTEAVLNANAVFGGIEIRVPDTWYVAARGQGIFGGYTDSTRYNPPVDPDKPKKTLIVVGMAVFGGVEIRN